MDNRTSATFRHPPSQQSSMVAWANCHFYWTVTRSGYRALLADVCTRVLQRIGVAASAKRPPLYVRVAAPTFGVFSC